MKNEKMNVLNFVELTDEELQKISGGIGGLLGAALNGLGNAMSVWNNGGFPTYNIGGNSTSSSSGTGKQYNPYDDF